MVLFVLMASTLSLNVRVLAPTPRRISRYAPTTMMASVGHFEGKFVYDARTPLSSSFGQAIETAGPNPAWGGDLAAEATAAVNAVQRAMQLCNALRCEMQTVEANPTSGKTMDVCDTQAGVSFIKPGDDTPVTAADFAIQGLVAAALKDLFPADRFMGEEDAGDLRGDAALRSLALRLCNEHGGERSEEAFLAAVDSGLEPSRGKGERTWVLDPIDGTKGFMTGEGFVIGLALVDADGYALLGVMGVPPEEESPPIMAAVRGHGLRWWTAQGTEPVAYEPPKPAWAARAELSAELSAPWLISPQKASAVCKPFGTLEPSVVCCGAMIKYFQVAAGRHVGFIQSEEKLKAWDHACGLICVDESGGRATDAEGGQVAFDGRQFAVKGGIVCTSRWAMEEQRQALLKAARRPGTEPE